MAGEDGLAVGVDERAVEPLPTADVDTRIPPPPGHRLRVACARHRFSHPRNLARAAESWVFGDAWALAVNDESLTTLLKNHLRILEREELAPEAPEVLREGGARGIVDMLLVKSIPMTVQQHEFVVVELKRPKKVLDAHDLTQLESYAAAVASDERFAKTKPNWTFLLLGNQMDCAVTVRAQQANRP